MKNNLFRVINGVVLSVSLTGFIYAQTTTTTTTTATTQQVVQNPDGSYTVIEYPVGREIMVDLTPMNMQGAKGVARVMRSANGTNIALDLSGLPADASSYYVYAVDPRGAVTLLGPTSISNGTGRATFTTPMNQFMLVLSPTQGLTTIANDTSVVFRSAVPQGLAVVPTAITSPTGAEKQVGTTVPVASTYDVPLLGVQTFSGKTTELRFKVPGTTDNIKGKAYIKPRKDGTAQIKLRFQNLQEAPKDTRYVVWLVSPDKQYTKLGQFVNAGTRRDESEIRGETALKDFGMFVTMESAEVTTPSGKIYTTFTVGR